MELSQPVSGANLAASAPATDYLTAIRAAARDPERLEQLYQTARRAHEVSRFTADLNAVYAEAPDSLLYAAWHFRLSEGATGGRLSRTWAIAIVMSVALGVVLWLLSDPRLVFTVGGAPLLAILAAPIVALFIMDFLALAARRWPLRLWLVAAALAAVTAYVVVVADAVVPARGVPYANGYLILMALHVPVLAWAALGIAVLGWRSSARNRFAFLTKSIEAAGTTGVALIAGGIFAGLTYLMFQSIGVEIPSLLLRLLVAGGFGLIPLLAIASVYDPTLSPEQQEFRRGFGRILTFVMQALLPLTLLVLVIYLAVLPFNFLAPFTNRDVLIVYNVMLFAIMGLLIGVTPTTGDDFAPRYQSWLRAGIMVVAGLVVLISVYALAATVYRTAQGVLTMNRLTIIGWNAINIAILVVLLVRQFRAGRANWIAAAQGAFRLGTVAYLAWAAFLVLALPWLF
jgi:hypothetical protein